MNKSEKENQKDHDLKSKAELKERIESKLVTKGISSPESASCEQIYQATVSALKDIMILKRDEFKKAKKSIEADLHSKNMPEVEYFFEHFIPSLKLTLDELECF